MAQDNSAAVVEIVQRGIGRRELRYGLMRIVRIFMGWPVWALGFVAFIYGVVKTGFIFIIADGTEAGITSAVCVYAFWHVVLALAGLTAILLGLSMAVPYQFDTYMPGVESERKCLHCGNSLEPREVFPSCSKCGSMFPLDLNTYIGRVISKTATVINILIMAGTALLLMAK